MYNINKKIYRIAEIDQMFQEATGWGPWMVRCAKERKNLVNKLHLLGFTDIKHKYLDMCRC